MKNVGLNIGFGFTLLTVVVAVFSVFTLDDRRGIFMVVRSADIQGFMLLVGVVIGLSKARSPYLGGALISGIVASVMQFFVSGAPLPVDMSELGKFHEFILTFLSIIFYGTAALTAFFCIKGYNDIRE
ncbi:hypothetical protein [Billgrantia gudaonensis]|uniref:hypothetical protein n=1 Tax=Billgrantia gudaonensis TaxID=376427 RepID=UPI00115F8902|nr:hypothetical protein [Halomonas gudaonensis]